MFSHSYGQRVKTVRGKRGGFTIANKVKLNFRFYNPNTAEEAANYIVKVFLEVNQKKLERILQQNVRRKMLQTAETWSHSE